MKLQCYKHTESSTTANSSIQDNNSILQVHFHLSRKSRCNETIQLTVCNKRLFNHQILTVWYSFRLELRIINALDCPNKKWKSKTICHRKFNRKSYFKNNKLTSSSSTKSWWKQQITTSKILPNDTINQSINWNKRLRRRKSYRNSVPKPLPRRLRWIALRRAHGHQGSMAERCPRRKQLKEKLRRRTLSIEKT